MSDNETKTTEAWLRTSIEESARTVTGLLNDVERIVAICDRVCEALGAGGTLFTAGNGGSAAEALHMAEELVGRFRANRRSLPAVALPADTTTLTCIANDFGFDRIFSRQIEGLGRPGDMLALFSTSGSARNLALALDAARRAHMTTVAFLGRDGGPLAGRADLEIVVPGTATERIQEAHQVLLHLVLEAVERRFAGE